LRLRAAAGSTASMYRVDGAACQHGKAPRPGGRINNEYSFIFLVIIEIAYLKLILA
jgi:hypothetical protein